MESPKEILTILDDYLPLLITLSIIFLLLLGTRLIGDRKAKPNHIHSSLIKPILTLVILVLGMVAAVIALPISATLRGQLLALIGLVITGIIAFSSTSFVSNIMAGLMLRSVKNFSVGDWVSVENQFGRVTEQGLFHTEIQTEDRDLVTLPNIYIASHPVKVVRASGTIISTELSLGYDIDHGTVEPLLIQAAEACDLTEPFVHILDVGDFTVTYRVAGFLSEVRHLLSVRSRLRTSVMDVLHQNGIEIVSPTFMNQRQLKEHIQIIPSALRTRETKDSSASQPEEIIFDKADQQASLEMLRKEREKLLEQIEALKQSDENSSQEEKRSVLDQISEKKLRISEIESTLENASSENEEVVE